MKVVVCYKNVPNSDSIHVNSDLSLDFSEASWEIGQYDLNAIEAAMSFPEAEVIAMTAAGKMADNSKQKKAVLSRGPEKMIGIKAESLDEADAYTVAEALAAAVRKIGDVDLLIFGEGSGDAYARQTGILTGAILGWPTVNGVKSMELEDNSLRIVRATEDAQEEFIIGLPAAVCVTGDINKPRIPGLKQILAAGKKPLEVISPDELGLEGGIGVETVSVLAPAQTQRRQQIFEEADDESLAELLNIFRNGR